jgi:hypothetical protein
MLTVSGRLNGYPEAGKCVGKRHTHSVGRILYGADEVREEESDKEGEEEAVSDMVGVGAVCGTMEEDNGDDDAGEQVREGEQGDDSMLVEIGEDDMRAPDRDAMAHAKEEDEKEDEDEDKEGMTGAGSDIQG